VWCCVGGYADASVFLYLQEGTQWDAFAHIFRDGKIYNDYPASAGSRRTARRNGVEQYVTAASRGVVIDVPRPPARHHLDPGERTGPAMLDHVCDHEGVTEPGDIVLLRTGTGDMGARRGKQG